MGPAVLGPPWLTLGGRHLQPPLTQEKVGFKKVMSLAQGPRGSDEART